MKVPIAIFASGRGSNFDAISSAIRVGWISAEIIAVVSDNPEALVLEKAREQKLNAICVPPPSNVEASASAGASKSKEDQRREHERRILAELSPLNPYFLVLAGYMRILTPQLIEAFRSERGYSRIVNVHPSLLPAFPGVNSYAQAFKYGTKVAGVTVHLVETEVDQGPICAQEAFPIGDCLSEAEVENRGLIVEHRLYPETLNWVLPEKFAVLKSPSGNNGRLCVRAN